LEIGALSALVGFAAGVVAAGFVAAASGVIVAGTWAKPAPVPRTAMAADRPIIGSSFILLTLERMDVGRWDKTIIP